MPTPAPTKTFINFHTFVWTPTTGAPIPVNRITSVKTNRDGTLEKFKGDAAKFYQVGAVPTQERMLEIDTADVFTAGTIPIGAFGSVSVIMDDAENGALVAGGGVTITLTQCVCVKTPFGGDHAKYVSGNLVFEGLALDGITDPLTVVPL